MSKVVHIIGNGDQSSLYQKEQRVGMKLTCNIPPWPVPGAYGTIMVDFKMMRALNEGSLTIPGDWILGMRPKIWMDQQPTFYVKHSHQVKEFYTTLPKYVANYTDFNCGHMAVHYAANKVKADEIHLYGFDSLFDFNLRSCSDFYLNSDRGNMNSHRLANNWRPVWENMFKEFPNTKFVLHHVHNAIKVNITNNVNIVTYDSKANMN
jgi:hypothetical protein|tara:strand:+ start:1117 stop:1737 length:621 start_codon:yes stop_codon:yes gene_type:complete